MHRKLDPDLEGIVFLGSLSAVFPAWQDALFCSDFYHQGWYLGFCGVWTSDAIQEV